MAYKSVLTILTDAGSAPATLVAASAVARREKGHLDILALGIDRTQTGYYYYAGASAAILQEALDRAQAEGEALAKLARERMAGLAGADVLWGVDTAVAQVAGLTMLVADRARFADLVVLPRPYGPGRTVEDEAVLEACLFEGRAPVMILPGGEPPEAPPRRILVGWDESAEAMAAVRAALPLLAAADLVDIVVIDPPVQGPDRSDPGGRLSQMIARHGARCEVSVLARTLPRIADMLNRHATDRAADMIVMGAYGHSRFRESIFGGATRHMLESAAVPLLMAH
jgi:nucleotide-binding universal stress UspA family protein